MNDALKIKLLDYFADDFHPLVRVARRNGVRALDDMLGELGGQKPHLPTSENFWRWLDRCRRNEEIRAKFQGNNHSELALEYNLTERQVRNILSGPQRGGLDDELEAA